MYFGFYARTANMNHRSKSIALVVSAVTLVSAGVMGTSSVNAQAFSEGLGYLLPIPEEAAIDGTIICSRNQQDFNFTLCSEDYQASMYGVVAASPSATIEPDGVEDGKFVVSDGKARVRVSNTFGDIEIGDYVTASNIPGVARLATENGYVLGTALEPLVGVDDDGLGSINVALNIHFESQVSDARTNLLQVLRSGLTIPLFEPLSTFRYILAAALILTAFTLGFLYFGRISNSGVEAIGRNPMASSIIRRQIFINIIVSVVIVLVGLFAAYLILIL